MLPPDKNELNTRHTEQEERLREEVNPETSATAQEDIPDLQQQEQLPKETRNVLKRWSQSLAASSSTLKKKTRATVEKAARKLDKFLPGESVEEARQKFLKIEEAQILKREVQPGMELANVYAAEIASTFGLQNVNVTSSNTGKDVITVNARYLDAGINFIRCINDPGKPKPGSISPNSIPFGSYRAVHEWIAAARKPEIWLTRILARAIMNVAGTTPQLIPISPGTPEIETVATYATGVPPITQPAIDPSAASVAELSKEKTTYSQILYKVEPLSPEQKSALQAFCASLTSPAEPRLRVPYQEVRLQEHGEDTILVLDNFPTGESACFPFIQEICALSLEWTRHFKDANSLLREIMECTTSPLSGSTSTPHFKVSFDLVARECFIQVPTVLLRHTWPRCLVHYLYANLGVTSSLVDTLPGTDNLCARNEPVYSKHGYYEMCTLATGGIGSMAMKMPNPEYFLPRLVKALQEALNRYRRTGEFCKLIPGAVVQPQLRLFCNANVGKIKAETAPLAVMVLNAETRDVTQGESIFTHVHHPTENWCSCEVSSEYLAELTSEQMKRVAQTATKTLNIQANIAAIVQEVTATLPLDTEDGAPFSPLEYSQITIEEGALAVPAVKLSWNEKFLESGRRTKLAKDLKIKGVHCSDDGIVIPLGIFTKEWSRVQRLVEEIKRKLKIVVEETEIPEPAPQKSFLSKFTDREDKPADKTEPGVLERISRNVASFFEQGKSKKKATTQKKVGLPISDRIRNVFVAISAAVVLAAVIYTVVPLIPRLKDIPDAVQAVGSILTGALISCIVYTCATKIQSDSPQEK